MHVLRTADFADQLALPVLIGFLVPAALAFAVAVVFYRRAELPQ